MALRSHSFNGSEKIGPFNMNAGTYYVGDLQHVFDTTTWAEIVQLFPVFQNDNMQGKFTLASGREICMFNLPSNGYRQRDYRDLQGRSYYQNSSLMGLTLVGNLETEYKDDNLRTCSRKEGEDWSAMMARLGNVIQFEKNFACTSVVNILKDGNVMGGDCKIAEIRFGDKVCIDTDESKFGGGPSDGDFLGMKGRCALAIARQQKEKALKFKAASKSDQWVAAAKPIKKKKSKKKSTTSH
jgi:hypothetical protein